MTDHQNFPVISGIGAVIKLTTPVKVSSCAFLSRERARAGGQISFALSPAGVSSLQPVAASRVRDCAPSRRMRRGRGAPRPAGLCTRPSPRGRLPRRVRARMRLSPLGSPDPRRAAPGDPEETPLLRAGACSLRGRRGKRDAPGSPFPAQAGRRGLAEGAAARSGLGGSRLPGMRRSQPVGAFWPDKGLCTLLACDAKLKTSPTRLGTGRLPLLELRGLPGTRFPGRSLEVGMGKPSDLGCKRSECVCSFYEKARDTVKMRVAPGMNRDHRLHWFRGHCTRIIGGKAFRPFLVISFKDQLGHETKQ